MTQSVAASCNALQDRNSQRELNSLLQAMRTDILTLNTILGGLLVGSATFNAANLADGAGETTTITVTGAALGDFALVSFGVDVAGMTVTAYVSAADTVSVRVQNESGGAVDLASTTIRALVFPRSTTIAATDLTVTA